MKKNNSFLHVYISYLLKDFFPTRISYFFCTASWTWHSLSRWIRSWRRRTGPEKVQICTIIEQWITVRQKKMKKMYVTLIEKNMNFFMPLFTNSFVQSSSFPFFFFSLLPFFLSFGFHLRFLPRTYLEVSVVLVEGLILSPGHPTKITIDYL